MMNVRWHRLAIALVMGLSTIILFSACSPTASTSGDVQVESQVDRPTSGSSTKTAADQVSTGEKEQNSEGSSTKYPALQAGSAKQEDPRRQTVLRYLNEEQRLKLFDLERADLRLGKALKPLLTAMKEGDEAAIRRALAADFVGELSFFSQQPTSPQPNTSYQLARLDTKLVRGSDAFVEWVRQLETHFEVIKTVSFPRDRNDETILAGSNVTTESEGAFRVAGICADGGPCEMSGRFRIQHQGMGEDFESLEAWIHNLELADVRFISSPELLFEDVTASCGVEVDSLHDHWKKPKEFLVFTGGAFLGDVDLDDHLDLLVTERDGARLYLGNGDGTFRAVDWSPLPHPKRLMGWERNDIKFAAIFDATGNGRNDVLCGGMLYEWREGLQSLVPVKGAQRLPNVDLTLGDYDRDGKTDLYLLNCGPPAKRITARAFFDDDRVKGNANVLVRNLGKGKFQNVTDVANASPGHGQTFAAAFFHGNDDLWPDLFGANEFGRNVLLMNRGDGTFEEMLTIDPVFGGFSMGLSHGDLDGDGKTDLYVSNMYSKAGHRIFHHLDLSLYPQRARNMFMASVNGNRFYRSRGDLTFEDRSVTGGASAVGWGWSGALADFNVDGWLDVYAPCGHRSVDKSKPDG